MHTRHPSLTGPAAILASALFFGSYGVWSRMMGGVFNDFFQGWTRALMILAILLPAGIATRSLTRFSARELPWVAAYAVPGSLVIPLYFYGFTRLPIGIATLSFYAALTITGYVLGMLVFGERLGPVKLVSLVLGLIGLGAVAGTTAMSSAVTLWPLAACVFAGICGGTEVVLTKKLSGTHSPLQLTATLYGVTLVLCLAGDLIVSGGVLSFPGSAVAWTGDVMHAVASAAAFLLVVAGYARTESSVGSIVGLMEIPFGILFGLILFGESLTPAVVGGTLAITAAAALPVVRGETG